VSDRPAAFHDLDPESFPFVIEFIADDTGETVHRSVVEGPGALYVPPIAKLYGPCNVRITFADGEILERRNDVVTAETRTDQQ
jgi:hypothetical protein